MAMAMATAAGGPGTYTGANIRVLEGIEAVRLRPSMYIGDTTAARAAPPGLRGRRQLDRRGDGRPLPEHPRDDPRRRLGLDRRRRPRHPGRRPPRVRPEHAGGRPDEGACRRQVRPRHVQGLGGPARRRRDGRQCALGMARGRGPPRGPGLAAGLPPGGRRRAGPRHRHGQDDRHEDPLPPRRVDLHQDRLRLRHPGEAAPRAGLPQQGDRDPPDRRAGRRAQGAAVLLVGGAPRVRRLPEPGADGAAPAGGPRGQGRGARGRGRGRLAVQRVDRRDGGLVLQQHPHRRGGDPPDRVPDGPDADPEPVRQGGRAGQEQGPGDHRRGLQGRADGDHQRAACPTRSSRGRPRPSWATARSRGSSPRWSTTSWPNSSRPTPPPPRR